MELALESELYCPSIDELRNYVDKIPNCFKYGIRCPCGSRKDKVYSSQLIFSTHIKSKRHKELLSNMNLNKVNHYMENEDLKKTVQNQKLIISKLEKELQNKTIIVDYLTQQFINKNNFDFSSTSITTNLLDI